MADLFKCDKCGAVGQAYTKRGRLILQELQNGTPHVSFYNKKADVCEKCFNQLKSGMNLGGSPATLQETSEISLVKV